MMRSTWPLSFMKRGGGTVDPPTSQLGALVRKTADQTIASNSALTWDTELYDSANFHSNSSDTSRFTISGSAIIRLVSNVISPSGNPLLQHFKGGASFRGMGAAAAATPLGTPRVNVASAPIAVSAADYFETMLQVDATANNNTWASLEILPSSLKYALVYKNGTTAIAASATEVLSWDSETVDTDGWHSTVTNPTRLTVPSGVTLVRVSGNIIESSAVTGQHAVFLQKNGASFRGRPSRDSDLSTGPEKLNIVSPPLVVTAGDYFEMVSNPENAATIANDNACWFAIEEVPSTYKRALVYKTGNQSISASTETILTWDAEVYDTDSIHDNSTNNSRLTVPSGCTRARLSFGVNGSSVTGELLARGQMNGADFYGMPSYSSNTIGTENLTGIGAWVDVVPGDYFELLVWSFNARTVGTSDSTWLCLECE